MAISMESKNDVRVIVVDEDSTSLKVWDKVLRSMNCCNYCLTNDPHMALALAREHHVDLVISEAVMSNGNGFELADEIHRIDPDTDVVISTAYNCDLKRFGLMEPHFHILHKPYTKIDDVMKFISDIIAHRDPRNDIDEDSWSENEEYPSVMEWKL